MTVVSEVHKTLEVLNDIVPDLAPLSDFDRPVKENERHLIRPEPYPRDSALRNLRATEGFKIDRDPDMVDLAISSIRKNEGFQREWTEHTWLRVEDQRKVSSSFVMEASPLYMDRFVQESLLKPVRLLLSGQKLYTRSSDTLWQPSVHCGTYSKRPDPKFDAALECAFVSKIEGKLEEASPYLVGMIYDEVDYSSLIELDGSTMLQTGCLSISAETIMRLGQSRITLKGRMKHVEVVLLKVFSVAVEFNLSYLTIINLSGAVFISVRDDRLTVGPHVPYKTHGEVRLPATLATVPSHSEQPPLLLSLTAMAYKAFHDKDWEPDQQWATLPSRPLPEPRKR